MTPYALASFTGAFLLFQLQLLTGKFVLPWFGGSPGVWTTCLLFYQSLLLGGYAYAHFISTRLGLRAQALVHAGLLVAALAMLPITPSDAWKAHLGGNPPAQILLLLTVSIGLPYFALSSTGPLMQQWFRVTHPNRSPYRLYALSNGGSLAALLTYPAFFERAFSRRTQADLWSGALVLFGLVCAHCAWRAGCAATPRVHAPHRPGDEASRSRTEITRFDKVLWVCLPALASELLLATTNRLCQEVAAVPLLWVLPLCLYLVSFILAFDHPRWYHRRIYLALYVAGVAATLYLLFVDPQVGIAVQITICGFTLFVGCMTCHGELYRLRPTSESLTTYYLSIAAGGALGAVCVSVVAPLIFNAYLELQIGLCALMLLMGVICCRQNRPSLVADPGIGQSPSTSAILPQTAISSTPPGDRSIAERRGPRLAGAASAFALHTMNILRGRDGSRAGVILIIMAGAIGWVLVAPPPERADRHVVSSTRNFYGTLKVIEHNPGDPRNGYYVLLDGATTHGLQRTSFPERTWPTSYYGENSGVGRAIRHLSVPAGRRRIGLVGLGTGTLAAYASKGDYVRIYEINPAVRALAISRFGYVASTLARVDIVMGDARISMEQELRQGNVQQFDLLVLDAFSSDAIPVHLLTKEALEIYWAHLKPGGVLAIHTSNRYLDLVPVVESLARHFQRQAAVIQDDGDKGWWLNSSTWVLLSTDEAILCDDVRTTSSSTREGHDPVQLWTDDRTSLLDVLR